MKVAIIAAIAVTIGGLGFLGGSTKKEVTLASFSTSLEGRSPAQRHNAELAISRLRGAVIPPGAVFSFNKRVGTWSRDQGYKRAPVSYNGTLIASWGGGVCQTSTTLYNAALLAGMDPVERSSHRFCPDYVTPGRDAAVAFDDVDLRFKNPLSYPVRIEGKIKGDSLCISIVGCERLETRPQIVSDIREVDAPRTFHISADGGTNQIKNSGKAGYAVATYRVLGDSKELLSVDNYPPMNRIVEGD